MVWALFRPIALTCLLVLVVVCCCDECARRMVSPEV
jgi:hypothetical protein